MCLENARMVQKCKFFLLILCVLKLNRLTLYTSTVEKYCGTTIFEKKTHFFSFFMLDERGVSHGPFIYCTHCVGLKLHLLLYADSNSTKCF